MRESAIRRVPSRVARERTVLVVDDEEGFRRLLYHALKDRFRVLEAHDADSAIAKVETGGVSVVLLDLHLPPRPDVPNEGLRVQERIGKFSAEVPIVVITANEEPETRRALLERGVRAFLRKPLDMVRLEEVLSELLEEGGD